MASADTSVAGSNEINELHTAFVSNYKRRTKRLKTYQLALETINFMRKVVVHEKYENIQELLVVLREHGGRLVAVAPSELVIRNVVLMVAKLAREENSRLVNGDKEPLSPYDSLSTLWAGRSKEDNVATGKKLRKGVIAAVKEVALEMETCGESISAQAGELVSAGDVCIAHSLSLSPSLDAFLESARRTRKHRVVLVTDRDDEPVPDFATDAIQLCDVAGKMCEATKVVLPGCAVFPDGSCLVPAGGLSICLSASRHSVPVYVLAAFYKISPFFLPDPQAVNPQRGPLLPFRAAAQLAGRVNCLNPTFDLIPAGLVTLYVSNTGSILPSHVYRIMADYYNPEDITEA